jgi:DNA-directed RNA polymerase specialized sigma24 family protein
MRAASRRTTRSASRAQASAVVPYVDATTLTRHVTTLIRSRWPGLDPRDYTWRTVARYCRERESAPRPANLAVWVRDTLHQLIVDDQRADRGVDDYHSELNLLLRELARRAPQQISPALLRRAVGHLHPRDVIIARLVLLGHQRIAIASRLGVTSTEVDQAYARSRARFRAVIGSDPELCHALRRAARESAPWATTGPAPRGAITRREISRLASLAETAAGVA